jgi:CRISPR type IV-associated protein Csf3
MNYQIRIQLAEAISYTYPFLPTFDGLLAYAFAKEVYASYAQRKYYLDYLLQTGQKAKHDYIKEQPLTDSLPQKVNYPEAEMIDFRAMPLAFHEKGYALASSMLHDKSAPILHYSDNVRKQFKDKYNDLIGIKGKGRQVQINKGDYKSIDLQYPLHFHSEVWFFFATDEIEAVKSLFKNNISRLFKKRNIGNGVIQDYQIIEIDFDFTQSVYRPIPARLVEEQDMVRYTENGGFRFANVAWQAPYWLPSNTEKCIMPL